MNAGWMRAGWQAAVLGLLLAGVTGCRHKTKVAVVQLPAPQQLPVDTTAKAEAQPWVQTVPLQPTPLPAVTVPTKKVKKPRKQVASAVPPPAPAAPVQVASSGLSPEANVIGSLTPGGNDVPQLRKQAAELIAALEKRLVSLPAEVKEKEKEQLLRVRNFERQAQTALDAGDSDGAVTLATKAKVLLDDLVK